MSGSSVIEVIIRGIPVKFPCDPYAVQIEYMNRVISCLETGGNGVLESPTGTGKTLSLLCASCAWLTRRKAELQAMNHVEPSSIEKLSALSEISSLFSERSTSNSEEVAFAHNQHNLLFRAPRIIYASRTHSQLTQAIQELKRTSYRSMKVSVLGSRDQMCIHPQVSKEESNARKTIMCRVKTKSKTCHFYNNIDRKKEEVIAMQDIIDIEDLVKLGRKLQCCPYYTSRELNAAADVIFLPYNYLLEPKTRKNLGLDLSNSIIILDEAHNIEKVCEESVSTSLSNTDIAMCIEEISQVMTELVERQDSGFNVTDEDSQPPDFTPDDLCLLKTLFLELEKALDTLPSGATYPGNFIFELLQKADLTPGKRNLVVEVLNKIVTYLSTKGSSPFHHKGAALQHFSDLLSLVFQYEQDCPSYVEKVKTSYKVHISCDEGNKKNADSWSVSKPPKGKILNFWCFSPRFGIEHLVAEGIHSLILTSGTLSPLDAFISELGIQVKETLENPHIVGKNQVKVAILEKGPRGVKLNSSYANRSNTEYLSSLGSTLVNFSCVIPDGLLVFFPSYTFMKTCQDKWQQSGVWSQIEKNKPIFVEPRTKTELGEVMRSYYAKIQDPTTKGACFMAVTRGKVSEGLDFADFNGRAVVVTGIPYPPLVDPRINLKKQYLDEKGKTISGSYWYTLEATKAINQAVGRVIRHANDYGLILLCDDRFTKPQIIAQLSSWLRPHIEVHNNFGPLIRSVREFFRNAEKQLPAPKGKPLVAPREPPVLCMRGSATFNVITTGMKRDHLLGPETVSDSSANWSVEDYLLPNGESSSTLAKVNFQNDNSSGILSALEKPSSIINFNEPFVPTSSTFPNCSSNTVDDVEQPQKRRKLKIVPLKFFSSGSSKNCETASSSVQNKLSKNQNQIKDYVSKVRKEMGGEACERLKLISRTYKNCNNVDDLYLALKAIFNTESSFHLLKDYECFVKQEHRQRFREHVDLQTLK